MNRTRRMAMVGALILTIILTPGLLSLTRVEPEKVVSGIPDHLLPPPTGMANIRLLGVNDFHGHLERFS